MNLYVPSAARLGFDGLDHEHDAMVEEINAFGRALDEGDFRDFESRFARLRSEMLSHFQHEEKLMASYDYPGLTWHKQEHRDSLATLDALVERCRARKRVEQEDLFTCFDTLVRDMLKADLLFKTYLYEQGVLA